MHIHTAQRFFYGSYYKLSASLWLYGAVVGALYFRLEITGSNPSLCTVECDLGQVIHTLPLLPSRIIWQQLGGGVNRPTMRHTSPVSVVLQLQPVTG